jgi:hypothetical protein
MLTVLIIAEALLLLLPATLLYIFGVSAVIWGFFSGNRGGVSPAFLIIAALLTIPGYGLFSTWWLVFRFRKISLKEVPRYIWAGAVVGALAAFLFISAYLHTDFRLPAQHISWSENFKTMLYFGGGPLVVLFTILLSLWLRNRQQLNN